jgi:tRNA/tmRNA/rRNA uracil-C5-methylase (TrmA/RlmC/RlmD family)
MLSEWQEFELTIVDVSRSGPGVARDSDGRVVFVPGTAPGDRVRVRISKVEKRFVEAELLEVLEPSAERVVPRCRVFGRCGGCQWQHLEYGRQWRTKVSGALHALSRVGVRAEGISKEEFPASHPWNYRNRIQVRGGAFGLGFYARGSHQVIPIERCEIARDELNAALSSHRDEAVRRGTPSKLELEVSLSGEVTAAWNAGHAAQGFRQVHDAQNELLRHWIAENLEPGRVLLDLFGGSGNLSLGVAHRFERIHSVDLGAGRLLERQGDDPAPANLRFHSADVGKWATRNRRIEPSAGGACIVDPPREGCGDALPAICALLEETGTRELIAVGCDPDSWARDVSRFASKGWRLDSLAFFDFFPQTVHFESVARLVRV